MGHCKSDEWLRDVCLEQRQKKSAQTHVTLNEGLFGTSEGEGRSRVRADVCSSETLLIGFTVRPLFVYLLDDSDIVAWKDAPDPLR